MKKSSTYWRAVVLFRVVSFSELSFSFMGRNSVAYFFTVNANILCRTVAFVTVRGQEWCHWARNPAQWGAHREKNKYPRCFDSSRTNSILDGNKSVNITQSRSTTLDLTSWTHSARFQDVLRRWSRRKRWAFHSEMKGKWYVCAGATKVHYFSRTSCRVSKLACVTLCDVKLKVLARFKTRKWRLYSDFLSYQVFQMRSSVELGANKPLSILLLRACVCVRARLPPFHIIQLLSVVVQTQASQTGLCLKRISNWFNEENRAHRGVISILITAGLRARACLCALMTPISIIVFAAVI